MPWPPRREVPLPLGAAVEHHRGAVGAGQPAGAVHLRQDPQRRFPAVVLPGPGLWPPGGGAKRESQNPIGGGGVVGGGGNP